MAANIVQTSFSRICHLSVTVGYLKQVSPEVAAECRDFVRRSDANWVEVKLIAYFANDAFCASD